MLVSDRQAQWGEKKGKEKKKVTGQGWVVGGKSINPSKTAEPERWGGGGWKPTLRKDSMIIGWKNTRVYAEGSFPQNTATRGGGSYPGFGMMSPRDQSLASSDWPCLLELEGSQGEDGGRGWGCAQETRRLGLWLEKGRGRKPSHAAALCFPPQHLHITPQWWQARRGR